MYNIRSYQDSDYGEIASWWLVHTQELIIPQVYDTKWSYVIEKDGIKLAAVSLLLTQSPEFSYFNALVSNPEAENEKTEAVNYLLNTLCNLAKEMNYTRIMLFSEHDNLTKRYKDLGFDILKSKVSWLGKGL